MHTVQCLATDDFACQIEQVVAQDHHMVAVPTNRTAHVQHDLRCKKKQGRNLVGDTFRQMEMARVERHNLILLRTVAQVKIIGTDRITFQTDAEQFCLDTILHVLIFSCKNLVERLFQYLTIFETAGGNFFTAVVNPQVHNTGIVLVFAHLLADPAAAFRMFDPEIADRIVGIRQRQVAALRMRKRSAVEIQFHPVLFRPLHPALKMSRFHFVTVDLLALEVAIYFMQVQAVFTGDQRSCFQDIGPHFVDRAGTSRVVTRHLDSARQRTSLVLETAHIVRLPAMHRKRYLLQFVHCLPCIHTDSCIAFSSCLIRLSDNVFFCHGLIFLRLQIYIS